VELKHSAFPQSFWQLQQHPSCVPLHGPGTKPVGQIFGLIVSQMHLQTPFLTTAFSPGGQVVSGHPHSQLGRRTSGALHSFAFVSLSHSHSQVNVFWLKMGMSPDLEQSGHARVTMA